MRGCAITRVKRRKGTSIANRAFNLFGTPRLFSLESLVKRFAQKIASHQAKQRAPLLRATSHATTHVLEHQGICVCSRIGARGCPQSFQQPVWIRTRAQRSIRIAVLPENFVANCAKVSYTNPPIHLCARAGNTTLALCRQERRSRHGDVGRVREAAPAAATPNLGRARLSAGKAARSGLATISRETRRKQSA